MFPVYAVPLGLVVGWLIGGRLEGLAALRFRWAWLALAGLAVQIALFSGRFDVVLEPVAAPLYVGSTAAVLAAVVRNVRVPGVAIIAIGALSNLAAILANGGIMPADAGAYRLAGMVPGPGITNSALIPNPALRPLTDIYAIPDAFPLSNVFSVGDVLIGIGLVATIALAMRRGRAAAVGEVDPTPGAAPVRGGTSPD